MKQYVIENDTSAKEREENKMAGNADYKSAKKAWNKGRRKAARPWKGLSVLTGIIAVLCILITVVFQIFDNTVAIVVSQNFHNVKNGDDSVQLYTTDFDTVEESMAYKTDLCERLEAEGAVLLMNENNALPLDKGASVSTFSNNSVNLVYGGTGSGGVDASTAPTLKEALEGSGFKVNETLWSFYTEGAGSEYSRENSALSMSGGGTAAAVGEVPWDVYTEDVLGSVANYGDAAIVTFSRVGGEGADLTFQESNYLALDENEKAILENLATMKAEGTIKKIVVLINSANTLQVDFLANEAYAIDACVWIGDVGQSGINAVADILAGDVNPSGSLVATYLYDNFSSPAMANMATTQYANADEYGLPDTDSRYYVIYQEGIYVGYRYFETRYEDVVMGTANAGNYDYHSDVAYPFGYGLSYTEFTYSDMSTVYNPETDQFEVTVTVTNAGDTYAGKETVQVYSQSPYTEYDKENGVEKASATLVGFEKTDVLAPGESETVTVYVDKSELASYDAYGAKTYILDQGTYYLTVATDAHDAVNNILTAKGYTPENTENRMDVAGDAALVHAWEQVEFDKTTYATSSTGYEITNQFDHADLSLYEGLDTEVTYLSRSNWEGTFPTEIISLTATEQLAKDLEDVQYDPADYEAMEMPTMGADNGLKLVDMIGLSYDAPQWEKLLDQLTFDEMASLIGDGFHWQMPVESVDAPGTHDENGPQGLTSGLMGGGTAMAYTSEDVMAATFNRELMEEVGVSMGNDCLDGQVTFLYGTGNNIHRTSYGGRNFEYYSEDGFLSGEICAAEVKGIASKGIKVLMKHCALNDFESNRLGVNVWANEQAIREVYLKAFQAPIEDADANGVMTAYNRLGTTWAGGDYNLVTNVLRNEWGCEGKIITDNAGSPALAYMNAADGILSGGSIFDAMFSREDHYDEYEDDAVIVNAMREASHRNLYAVANSAAMNGIGADTEIDKITLPALTFMRVLTAVFVGLCILSITLTVVKTRNYKKNNPKPVK